MCGIYGVVQFDRPLEVERDVLDAMAASLEHRGPDGCGRFHDVHAAIGIRLLRIIDPGSQHHQPFRDEASGVVVVCNGEIYNATSLRTRFSTYPFKTRSDVEPILPLFLNNGVEALADLDGMFAIAIWDPRHCRLLLARDRAGEKPLYFASRGRRCVFGSEIQALLEAPGFQRSLNLEALSDVLSLGYVTSGQTMFGGVAQIEPGTSMVLGPPGPPVVRTFWRPWSAPRSPSPTSPRDALDAALERAVTNQLAADVPVGIMTSGGVDSALITAYAAKHLGPGALATFAVGFTAPSYDERSAAAATSRVLGTNHHEVVATQPDLAAQLRTMIADCADPIVDPAVLPTAILAREARRHVGVVLGGEGADELFGGYPTYLGHVASRWFNMLPPFAHRLAEHALRLWPATDTKVPLRWLTRRFVSEAAAPLLERHVAWFGAQLGLPVSTHAQTIWQQTDGLAPLTRFMAFDYATYLRYGLLPKIDRATMLASLEARAPYLDPAVTTLAFSLADRHKVRGLHTKVLLKQVAARHLPRHIVHRRKRGLSVPVNQLMRAELERECDHHLRDERFAHWGLLPRGRVGDLVSEHRSRRANHGRALWTLLVLGMWTDHWIGA